MTITVSTTMTIGETSITRTATATVEPLPYCGQDASDPSPAEVIAHELFRACAAAPVATETKLTAKP